MELWNHCENPYPFVPAEVLDEAPSVRASLPNKYCDPKIAARLYDEIFDEYRLCDDLGLHIVTNEHHSGINNLWAASPVITGVVARITRNVRILSLGTLVTVRPDPVRVAEEYATIDVLSKGRLEIGFVKSGATEMVSGDANPMRIREREWEAIDLIEKALTTHDGPFSWEGKFFTHPHVNIWPRCYQEPRPEFWAATSDLPARKLFQTTSWSVFMPYRSTNFQLPSKSWNPAIVPKLATVPAAPSIRTPSLFPEISPVVAPLLPFVTLPPLNR